MNKIIRETVNLLKDKNINLGSCESLTGGLFASTITSFKGVSSFFKGAIISYSTLVKRDLLKIDQKDIDQFGVVSKEISEWMAKSTIKLLDVDLSISFTGNAGPTAMEGKEVGLVYIGLCYKNKVSSYQFNFRGKRNKIRKLSVLKGFELIKKILEDETN